MLCIFLYDPGLRMQQHFCVLPYLLFSDNSNPCNWNKNNAVHLRRPEYEEKCGFFRSSDKNNPVYRKAGAERDSRFAW